MNNKKYSLYAFLYIIIPLIIIILVANSFDKSIEMNKENSQIVLSVPQCPTMTIDLKKIRSYEYLEDFDIGNKQKGVNDGEYYAGYYENSESQYFAFIHSDVHQYIKINMENQMYVINDESVEKTILLKDAFSQYIENKE